ncbi:MAG: exo-alpha-sialidase [Burkholderiales bacterium]|nr:exo-alpha-sialidase [Burkholderiales bacterium]
MRKKIEASSTPALRLLRWMTLALGAALCSVAAQATAVSWSGLNYTDDNGGAFIANASSSQSGASNEVLDIQLPDFVVSNFSSFSANTVGLGVTAGVDHGGIVGFLVEIFGSFDPTDTGSMANYDFNNGAASGSLTASGSFQLDYTLAGSQDLVGMLQALESGGTTAISEVRLTALLVPEPGSVPLVSLAMLAMLGIGRWSRRAARRSGQTAAVLALGAAVSLGAAADAGAQTTSSTARVGATRKPITVSRLSPMGALAKRLSHQIVRRLATGARNFTINGAAATDGADCDDCNYDPDFTFPGGGSNAEIRVAADPSGQNIVIGFNDARGFNFSPTTLSGVARSTDGGLTFTDGGRLPTGPTTTVGSAVVPQIYGDPDVKWVPGGTGCNFVYSSIMVVRFPATGPATGTAQTMSVHTTTDCGLTWHGPIEVTPATNPYGLVSSGSAYDAADKEFIDVDPDTGRVLLTWTNFTNGQEIRATWSDTLFTAAPSWAPSVIVSPTNTPISASVQGSMPRFAGNGSNNAYIVWEQYANSTDASGYFNYNVGYSRSTDNGLTWSSPVSLTTDYQEPDQIPGNDRIHSFPSIAVDNSSGSNQGNVYVVYASNASGDGADVMVQRSTDGGLTFSAPVSLSPRPGADRSQWFPTVAVDRNTGRVSVVYYDQSNAAGGDLTQANWVYSDNGGVTWSTPSRVCAPPTGIGATNSCDRPFHAGYGNDTSQPNLGDYIGVDAMNGALYASFAGTPKLVPYTDGQPAGSMTTPDVRFRKLTTAGPALDVGAITIVDSGGNGYIDAGDTVKMIVPLTNYVTNPATSPKTYTSVTGTLSTTTAGITLLRSSVSYANIAPGATVANALEYVFQVSPGYVPGTPIDFQLAVSSGQGSGALAFYRNTGTPVATPIFAENFDGAAVGAMPAGWVTSHGGGSNVVPWKTSNSFCGTTSNALFHVNANDAGNPTRFERAFSPLIGVPAGAQYVTLEFDTCYDTEDDPSYHVLAYDGLMLRITDQTPGRTLRSVLVEAYAEEFTTGGLNHLPKHLPRNSSSAYLQDLSAWAGFSNGFKHVKLRLPGMQGSTVQMRWEYTQDAGGICSDVRPGHACGVMVDNIVMRSVTLKSDELATVSMVPVAGAPGKYMATIKAQPIAGAGGITVALSSSNPAITSMPATVTIPAGAQVSAPFAVQISPAASGTSVTITATGPSNVRSAGIRLP